MIPIQYVAFESGLVASLPTLNQTFGEQLYDGRSGYQTIIGRWDDSAHTKIRAANLWNESFSPLNDGRFCIVGALWSDALYAFYTSSGISGASLPDAATYSGLASGISGFSSLSHDEYQALRVGGNIL